MSDRTFADVSSNVGIEHTVSEAHYKCAEVSLSIAKKSVS